MTLLLVRHAQSEWNAKGRWQGSADVDLSELGRHQAAAAGTALAVALAGDDLDGPVTSLWSSGLRRARLTAVALGAGVGWRAEPGEVTQLREHDVGQWSGLTRPEIDSRWPGAVAAWGAGRLASPPGGETRAAFDARVEAGLAHLLGGTGGGLGVAVAHGGVLRAVARRLGRPERAYAHLEGFVLAGDGALDELDVWEVGLDPHWALLCLPGPAPAASGVDPTV